MLAWFLVSVVILACWAYIEFTPKDVDPNFVLNQASVSATKLPGESAVLRSLANTHGTSLLGSTKPLSQFRFSSLWDEVSAFQVSYVTQQGHAKSLTNFKELVGQIQSAIRQYPQNSEITMNFSVGVEALLAIFAVVLSGRIPRLIEDVNRDESQEDKEFTSILSLADYKLTKGNSGIAILRPDGSSVLIIIDQPSRKSPEEHLKNVEVFNSAHLDFLRFNSGSISQVQFGVAIAAQIMGLGIQNRWSSKDSVFMAPGPLTPFSMVAMFTALSVKAPLVFAQSGPMLTATSVLFKMRPTILVSDDETMRTLCKQTDEFQLIDWLKYGLRRARLAKGALTKPGMVSGFQSVRLIHTASGGDPYKWLSNGDLTKLRVLTGNQVIHVYTPGNSLALCQTSIGDYRSGKGSGGVLFGPPLPGLEIKLENTRLMVKHFNSLIFVPVGSESSEDARIGRDGCLYVPEKRKDFSERYYYTGELN